MYFLRGMQVKKVIPIVLLSGGSMLLTFGAMGLYVSQVIGHRIDSLEYLQITIVMAGLVFMGMGIRHLYRR